MGRRDTTVRLERGSVIVEAAKRASGHLYVASPDCRVAVTGTVFAVNRGVKGSRVSVVEGEVHVERAAGNTVLRAGDQVTTHSSMGQVAIQDEIAWSGNVQQYIALLREFAQLKTKLDTVQLPGMRYGSRLLDRAPTSTLVFVSVPNLGQAMSEAGRLFQTQLQQSSTLREWWERDSKNSTEKVQEMIERLRRFSDYLGDEIVFALTPHPANPRDQHPVIIAEVQRAGFKDVLQAELAKMSPEGAAPGFQIIEGNAPIVARQRGELLVVLRDNLVVAGEDASTIEGVFRPSGQFSATDFGRAIADAFRRGTGILVAADLRRIAEHEPSPSDRAAFARIGFDQVRYLIGEQKQIGTETQHSAVVSFAGVRQGVASWLDIPAPIGGLSFVSPDAQFAAAAVLKDPAQLLMDLLAIDPGNEKAFDEAQMKSGINLREIAATLGGEFTIAIDGAVGLAPPWRVAVEVLNAAKLQDSIDRVVRATNILMQMSGKQGIALESETVGGNVYHRIRGIEAAPLTEINYSFIEGYLVAAPTRALLLTSIENRRSGVSLTRSDRFRQLLPADHHVNFSGMVYQNAGKWIGLAARGMSPSEQQAAMEALASMGPVLVCLYGEQDRIEIASKASTWGLVMQTALGPLLARNAPRSEQRLDGTRRAAPSYR
jgi:hypothetical protein